MFLAPGSLLLAQSPGGVRPHIGEASGTQRQGLGKGGGTPTNPSWPDHPKASALLNLSDLPPGASPVDNPAGKWNFGPNPSGADDMTSCLARVPYQGAQTYAQAKLLTPQIYRLDGQSGRPKVYGVCGLAVVDILPSAASDSAPDELAVGALDGHLLVFERKDDGAIGQLLYQTQVEGAVGAYNSIQAHDLDGIPGNELYVATSFGLRRWIR